MIGLRLLKVMSNHNGLLNSYSYEKHNDPNMLHHSGFIQAQAETNFLCKYVICI